MIMHYSRQHDRRWLLVTRLHNEAMSEWSTPDWLIFIKISRHMLELAIASQTGQDNIWHPQLSAKSSLNHEIMSMSLCWPFCKLIASASSDVIDYCAIASMCPNVCCFRIDKLQKTTKLALAARDRSHFWCCLCIGLLSLFFVHQ